MDYSEGMVERAREAAYSTVRFAHARLPAFDPDRQFELVLCHATLDYVADVENAVENL